MTEARPGYYVITLLRHGESVGNAEARWQGQSEYPLTERGQSQAHALAARWKQANEQFDLVITSPLSRAKQTAGIVAEALSVPLEEDPLWMERNIGGLAGLTFPEVTERFPPPDFINPYNAIGGGEGDWELFLRGGLALQQLLHRQAGRYLIVSHGGLLNQVMYAVVGIAPHANNAGPRFRFGNTGFARLIYYPHQHRWAIDRLNDRAHLAHEDTSSITPE
jgi:broad specificity phosphatase PhoE